MSTQRALTLVTPVLPECMTQLASVLKELQCSINNGTFTEVERLGTIHYFRLVLLEGKLSTAQTNLMLSLDYDGEEDQQLTNFAADCPAIVDMIYECCADYMAPTERTPVSRKNYLKKWINNVAAFYVGAPGRSLKQVKQESALRDHIWNLIRTNDWDGKTAKEVHGAIRQQVMGLPEFEWTRERVPVQKVKWWNFVLVAVVALLLLPLTLLFVVVAVIWIVVLQIFHERKDKSLGLNLSQVDGDFIRNLEQDEDYFNQNQFSQIIPMKPGKMRLITLKALMIYARFRCHNEFVKGELMGIPTIHFARWVLLDDNKTVLFLSNFDGSWQQYLGDFIDKSGWGLTAIFSNTVNFPPSRYLFWGGAYDEEHFLAWARYYLIRSQVWYCACPKLSIKNINTNTLIRTELIRDLNETQAQTFLNRF